MDSTAGDTIEPWRPKFSANPQIEGLASNRNQGASVFTASLGNIRCTLPLHAMNINYGTAAASLAASRTVPLAFLNNKIHLQVIQDSETQYFPNAVFSDVEPDVQGSNVTWNMNCVTQMVTATDPS